MTVMGECWSCKRTIEWAVSTKGKRMPLDVDPAEDGNVILDGEGIANNGERLPLAIVLGKGDVPLGDPVRRVSHFVTCPDADQHRRSR